MSIPGYKILRKIGDGGMSTVYLSIQLSVGREVALKVLSPELRTDPSFGDRFFREANIVGTLSHPNIISIYDVGNQGEHYYIAMDYLPGKSCSDKIKTGDLSLKETLSIIKDIASALDYAHGRGFIHCDVKPDNILFRHDSSAVLTDFGIATSTNIASNGPGIKAVAGTPHYMSPEQTQGKSIDGRSDLYSLGILLYEMLVGEVPYQGKDAVALAVKHLTAPIPKLPNEYIVFQPILNRLLAKKPSSRYPSGRELIDAINALESSLGKDRGITNTEPTALQAFSLLEALIATFGHVTSEMLKRVFVNFSGIKRSGLSEKDGVAQKNIELPETLNPTDNESSTGKTTFFEESATNVNTRTFGKDLDLAISENRAKKILSPKRIIFLAIILSVGSTFLALNFNGIATDQLITFASVGNEITHSPKIEGDDQKTGLPGIDVEKNKKEKLMPEERTKKSSFNIGSASTEIIAKPKLYTLSVKTTPKKAKVRILNIKPRYRDGIKVSSGKYHIAASAKGYVSYSRWVNIKNKNVTVEISLDKLLPPAKTGDKIQDTLAAGIMAPAMVIILPESFIMGDSLKEKKSSEKPLHMVQFGKAFAIGINEITYAEYDIFATETNRAIPSDHGNDRHKHPVTDISWIDAKAYTGWLARKTGKNYRLPTESEWEYAARSGTTGNYWWEEESAKNKANCRKGCNSPWVKIFNSSSAPVGSFDPNNFGLYDTSGNVAEWVEDCFHDNYQGAPVHGEAWRESECKYYSVRGGSFRSSDAEITSSSRARAKPGENNKTIGFRIARDL